MLAVSAEILLNHGRVEQIDAGRNRRVRSEDVAHARRLERLLEGQLLFVHQHAYPLNCLERGMAFVHVMNGWAYPERFQSSQAADTKNNFLPDTFMDVTPVELVGDLPMLGRLVLGNVCVEHVQFHASDIDMPYLDEHLAGRQVHAYDHFFAFRAGTRPNGQSVEIVQRRALLLPSIGIQMLLQVTALIQQPNTSQSKIAVARRLQVVAPE